MPNPEHPNEWCPLISTCPRYSEGKCHCPFIQVALETMPVDTEVSIIEEAKRRIAENQSKKIKEG